MLEIERKFLVDKAAWQIAKPSEGVAIRQGYIFDQDKGVLRVRTKGAKGFLTFKGKNVGMSRVEIEREISIEEAMLLLDNFCDQVLSKVRYEVQFESNCWEVDEFEGKLAPLIVAEIELTSETQSFEKPTFVTQEVTDDKSYYNSELIKRS